MHRHCFTAFLSRGNPWGLDGTCPFQSILVGLVRRRSLLSPQRPKGRSRPFDARHHWRTFAEVTESLCHAGDPDYSTPLIPDRHRSCCVEPLTPRVLVSPCPFARLAAGRRESQVHRHQGQTNFATRNLQENTYMPSTRVCLFPLFQRATQRKVCCARSKHQYHRSLCFPRRALEPSDCHGAPRISPRLSNLHRTSTWISPLVVL